MDIGDIGILQNLNEWQTKYIHNGDYAEIIKIYPAGSVVFLDCQALPGDILAVKVPASVKSNGIHGHGFGIARNQIRPIDDPDAKEKSKSRGLENA